MSYHDAGPYRDSSEKSTQSSERPARNWRIKRTPLSLGVLGTLMVLGGAVGLDVFGKTETANAICILGGLFLLGAGVWKVAQAIVENT